MNLQRWFCGAAAAALPILGLGSLGATAAHAADAIRMSHVRLADGAEALLYEPVTPGAKSHIALVNLHSFASYLNHSSCANMAAASASASAQDNLPSWSVSVASNH